jgi:hypothetical protein
MNNTEDMEYIYIYIGLWYLRDFFGFLNNLGFQFRQFLFRIHKHKLAI